MNCLCGVKLFMLQDKIFNTSCMEKIVYNYGKCFGLKMGHAYGLFDTSIMDLLEVAH